MRLTALALMLGAMVALIGCGWFNGDGDGNGNGKGASASSSVITVEVESFAALKELEAKDVAGGGKAMLFQKYNSSASTEVSLKAGTYRVVMIMSAPDSDHDALDLELRAVDRALGMTSVLRRVYPDQYNQFVEGTTQPEIVLPKAGKVKVSIMVDDETDVQVDRVEFHPLMEKS
jgi:hypothetical protein